MRAINPCIGSKDFLRQTNVLSTRSDSFAEPLKLLVRVSLA